MEKKVRVRFAPSPTGGLHLGGVRTVLFNYLFAKKHKGDFILRIEDTDQSRFVPGAEEYILNCLKWCGLNPDESPEIGGHFGPYRQSERKENYRKYAEQLIEQGNAYYAFDTADELDKKRKEISNFQYSNHNRLTLKNSLSLPKEEVEKLLKANIPYVIRIKMPEDEQIHFVDLIRGDVSFNSNQVDDKVLLKADGMPTYHLAVVVDDYLMKITHAFRGEEWLPSAPVHILLWKYLGWINNMPQWAHLPLILKPDGHGKLSKRDGDRLGFPVFAMNWTDPKTGELTKGFKELGFLPEAFINLLANLGWNDGTEQEIFSLAELIEKFSLDHVHKNGAKFDFEKAKWFNAQWIKHYDAHKISEEVIKVFKNHDTQIKQDNYLDKVIDLIKDRCVFISDFYEHAWYFYKRPEDYDIAAVKPKWNTEKTAFFRELIKRFSQLNAFDISETEPLFKALAEEKSIKPGELLLPFRVMLVGGKFGPQVFDIAALLKKEETIKRIEKALVAFEE